MSAHPSPEALFDAAAKGVEGPYAPHLADCPACRVAYDRLRVGASLLDVARKDDALDAIDWGRLEEAIQGAAERTAADIRSGRLRPTSSWRGYVVGAMAFAAAAVGVWYVRGHRTTMVSAPIAARAPAHPARVSLPERQPERPAPPFEGVILLAAGGARQTMAGASVPVRLSSSEGVREGARVETGALGRAVFTVQPTVTLDVRPESEATLVAMHRETTTVALARGELAIDREGEAGAVAVHVGRWQVAVEGDATARATSTTLRVVLLAGRATVRSGEPAGTVFTGPVVFELPAEAGDARTLGSEAHDAMRLDLTPFRAEGTLWQLPSLPPGGSVSLRGHGALPDAVEALRLTHTATLDARVGRREYTLEVGSGRVLQWRRVSATIAADAPTSRPVVVGQAPSPMATALPPMSEGRELTQAEIHAMSRTITRRIGHCFTRCVETNQCREPHGVVEFDVSADGTTTVGALDPSVANARPCLAHEARFIRFPATGGAFPFQVNVR
jgi:hypothetical protein